MSVKSPMSPRSGDTPPKAPQEEKADTEDVESLFDARPADEPEHRSILTAALEALSKACRDAAAWIAQVFSGIGGRDEASVAVSAPRNLRKGTLPPELQQANDDALAGSKAAAARKEFVESTDSPPAVEPATPDPDREAFDAYVRLCKREGREPGSEGGASSHRDLAVRYARAYVQLVAERQSRASQEGKEFWLGSADQEKLRAAVALLKRQDGGASDKSDGTFSVDRPIQANSTLQLKSFMAWRDWSRDSAQLPDDADFSIDAAVAYAHELCAVHAGKDTAKDPRAKDLLGSAFELIAREDHYRRNFEVQREAVELVRGLDGLREAQDMSADREEPARGAPPAAPPPRVRSTPNAGAPSPSTDPPLPPLLRVPSVRPTWHTSSHDLPELSTLDDELQVEAGGLLHRFLQLYAEKLDSGVLDFDDHPEYFSPLAAAAAADFLRQADSAPGGTDVRNYAAANHILREFERRRARPRPGS